MALILPASSLSSSSAPASMPVITFFGPNDISQIKAIAPSGQEVARIIVQGTSKNSFTLSRIASNSNAPPTLICSAEKSYLSGSTSMLVHGQNVKVKSSSEDYKTETTSMGTMKWKSSSGGEMTLKDENKAVLARGNTKERKLEVFASGNEIELDTWLAAWVVVVKQKTKDEKDGAAAVEIFSAVLGAN